MRRSGAGPSAQHCATSPAISWPAITPRRSAPKRAMQRDEPRLILASSSASRRALLEAASLRFEVRPAFVDEEALRESAAAEGASPGETALLLAELKARRIALREPEAVV